MALNTETARRLISTQCGFTEAQQRFLGKVIDDLYDNKVLAAVSTQTTTVNASTTLVDIDGLSVELTEPGTYAFEATLFGFSGTTPDFDFGVSVPSGAFARWGDVGAPATAAADNTGQVLVAGIGDDQLIRLAGTVSIAVGEEGTFKLQFAQNVSNASDTQIYDSSTLVVTKVSDTAYA